MFKKNNKNLLLSRKIGRALASALILSPVAFTGITALAEGENYSYGNPYSGGWSNCTWSAWQLVYNNLGIALPDFGYSTNWYAAAAAMGYSVGSVPMAGSIGVYYGHVVYVAAVDGDNIYVQEGGYCGGYNEGWANGYSGRFGQALIGYIYLNGAAGDATYSYSTWDDDTSYSSEVTIVEDTRTADTVIQKEPGVELAISPNVADTEVENLDEAVLKKYSNDSFTEPVKNDEAEVAKEMQEEDASSKVKISDSIETTSTAITEVTVNSSKAATELTDETSKSEEESEEEEE